MHLPSLAQVVGLPLGGSIGVVPSLRVCGVSAEQASG